MVHKIKFKIAVLVVMFSMLSAVVCNANVSSAASYSAGLGSSSRIWYSSALTKTNAAGTSSKITYSYIYNTTGQDLYVRVVKNSNNIYATSYKNLGKGTYTGANPIALSYSGYDSNNKYKLRFNVDNTISTGYMASSGSWKA